MAITGPASYGPTMGSFLAHWDEVNTELGAGGPLLTSEGASYSDLSGYRDQLAAFASSIQGKVNVQSVARGTININKGALLGRVGEFNRKVRGKLKRSAFVNSLPDVPPGNSGEAVIVKALDDMDTLWVMINTSPPAGFTPPLLLLDGYAKATFDTELAALKTAYRNFTDAEKRSGVERERRNDVQDLAYAVMRDYQDAVQGEFPPEHALIATIPRLSPLPGHTPSKVTLTAVWDPDTNELVLTWTVSTDPDLADYQIRMTLGDTYDTDSDSTIDSLVAGTTPLEYRTTEGLANPGDQASFKVYVVLTTGNEAGSNTVTFTRP